MSNALIGCVDIWIDNVVPCLKDNESGELKETVVIRIESPSYLREFREDNGWKINWNQLPKEAEVYALLLKDHKEVQGLVALINRSSAKAAFIHWACTAPHNNIHDFGSQRYSGVGGHLFAIAAEKSIQWGYSGAIYGFALNKDLLNHYIETVGATYLGIQHPYHFMIDEIDSQKLLEVYTYEWI